MNRALLKKAVADSWLQLAVCSAILLLFSWLFVWLMSQFDVGAIGFFLKMLPPFAKRLAGAPMAALATPVGQISVLYVHVVTLLVCFGWALGRGSDSVSGEIGRGTMDLILSLPVRRATVVLAPALVTGLGTVVLVGAMTAGITIGLATVSLSEEVAPGQMLPGTVNLFCMVFCATAISSFVSSWSRDRWRAILIAGGFFVVSLILKMAWRLWPGGDWLKYGTFLAAYQPQQFILEDTSGPLALQCNLTLIGVGLFLYAAAVVVLTYRDIPAAK